MAEPRSRWRGDAGRQTSTLIHLPPEGGHPRRVSLARRVATADNAVGATHRPHQSARVKPAGKWVHTRRTASVVPPIVVRQIGHSAAYVRLSAPRRMLPELAQCPFQRPIRALIPAARGLRGPLAPMRRVRDQAVQQLTPFRAMTVAVEFDAPIDVVDEMTQAIVVMLRAVKRIEKPAERISGMMSSRP